MSVSSPANLSLCAHGQLHVNGRLLGDYAIVKELDANGEFLSELEAFRGTHSPDRSASPPKPDAAQQGAAAAAWKSAVQQVAEGNEDALIDERDLLADEALRSAEQQQQQQEECAPNARTKRKACKNCSCGLAEELAAGAGDAGAPKAGAGGPAKSACGSCYLGDAFRCETCPYKVSAMHTNAHTLLSLALSPSDPSTNFHSDTRSFCRAPASRPPPAVPTFSLASRPDILILSIRPFDAGAAAF
jgi:hypothetical protein